jgi:methyl-accepting chemotaxis protein
MLIVLVTSALAVLLAGAALLVQEVVAFRRSLAREATVLADVLGQNCTAAVSFGDEAAAKQTLAALTAEPHIVAAALYDSRASLFAEYVRAEVRRDIPAQPGEDGHRFDGESLRLFRPMVLNGKRIGTMYLQADLQAIRDRIRSYGVIVGLVLLGALAVASALSAGLQHLISGPILALATTARRVAEAREYTVRARRVGRDEVGQLTDAFNQMLAEIQLRQAALEQANQSLLAQAGEITESAGVLSASAGDISALGAQLASTATESATAVAQTTATVEEVRQTAHMATQKAREVADGAQKTAQVSQVGKQSTEATIAGMQRIRQQMESIAESMMRLSEQTQAIGQIIASVDDLAAQSNLLAVNAAIEAAKAGEQGKGFAVVAQEVKSLAEQSRQATNQVRTILHDIQAATAAAAMATEQGTKAVEAGVKQSEQAGEAILALTGSVAEAAQAATQISASNQQQLIGVEQVAAAMTNVRETSSENVASARQLETAARNLNELGQKLKALVARDKA